MNGRSKAGLENNSLRRILGKSFWSSCVRFSFADLLTNTCSIRAYSVNFQLGNVRCTGAASPGVAESWIFLFTHDLP